LEVGAIRSQFTPNHRRISIRALALAPLIFAAARDHVSWGANALNLTAVRAAWNIAEWLADRQQFVKDQQGTQLAKSPLA
jgi:hypothetical protein